LVVVVVAQFLLLALLVALAAALLAEIQVWVLVLLGKEIAAVKVLEL